MQAVDRFTYMRRFKVSLLHASLSQTLFLSVRAINVGMQWIVNWETESETGKESQWWEDLETGGSDSEMVTFHCICDTEMIGWSKSQREREIKKQQE